MYATPNTRISIASMVVLTVVAAAVYVALPMMVGALIQSLGVSLSDAGLLAAADMLGASVAAFAAALVIASGRWRALLLLGTALLAAGNFWSGVVHSFGVLVVARLCAGFGEGVLLSVANASIGETRNPDRVFGYSIAAQLGFGALALYLIPWILAHGGLRAVFWGLGAMTFCAGALVRYMPERPKASESIRLGFSLSRESVLGLAGVLTCFIAGGGVWAYLEPIGNAQGIQPSEIATALALSSLAGLVGACCASWLNLRIGRLKPLLIATLFLLASVALLNVHPSFGVFVLAVSGFNFMWNFSVPFQFGTLAEIDASRRSIAFGGVVVFVGLTIGPALAAEVIRLDSLTAVSWLAALFSIISLALFAILLRPLERTQGLRSRDVAQAIETYGKS